jgi:outer membrane receptor for Fe3+-dicitrate
VVNRQAFIRVEKPYYFHDVFKAFYSNTIMRKLSAANTILFGLVLAWSLQVNAQQQQDSVKVTELKKVVVISYISPNGIGHLNQVQPPYIYAGKKTEVIVVDSLDANKAINNTRQILGRIPGLNIVESETGGFVANGIGVRGLNPVQSLEVITLLQTFMDITKLTTCPPWKR